MPGIITHNRILFESIEYLKNEKKKNSFSNSILSLFKSKSFLKAGLFGAIGPNIFDYLPFRNDNFISGNSLSYELHSTRNEMLLKSMLNTIFQYKDQNNEWSSTQKAYIYGFISHIISDSIFHPFIYYWSGLPSSLNKKDLTYFREQHLLFEYNLDTYFNQNGDSNINTAKFIFNLGDMLPIIKYKKSAKIEQSIKVLLINSLKEIHPELFRRLNVFKFKKNDRFFLNILIDLIPFFIKFTYKIKNSRDPRLLKIITYIKRKNLFYSDYLINYPSRGRVNTHVLNLHKERWFHPSGVAGLHYESVTDLLLNASEQIANLWKKIEEMLYKNTKDISQLEQDININSYTGKAGLGFDSMNVQNPVKLRFF